MPARVLSGWDAHWGGADDGCVTGLSALTVQIDVAVSAGLGRHTTREKEDRNCDEKSGHGRLQFLARETTRFRPKRIARPREASVDAYHRAEAKQRARLESMAHPGQEVEPTALLGAFSAAERQPAVQVPFSSVQAICSMVVELPASVA